MDPLIMDLKTGIVLLVEYYVKTRDIKDVPLFFLLRSRFWRRIIYVYSETSMERSSGDNNFSKVNVTLE